MTESGRRRGSVSRYARIHRRTLAKAQAGRARNRACRPSGVARAPCASRRMPRRAPRPQEYSRCGHAAVFSSSPEASMKAFGLLTGHDLDAARLPDALRKDDRRLHWPDHCPSKYAPGGATSQTQSGQFLIYVLIRNRPSGGLMATIFRPLSRVFSNTYGRHPGMVRALL